MPIITFEMGVGQADEAQKQQLIRRLTAESVAITGIPESKFTILIHEVPHTNLGIGGKTLKEIRAGS
jgi:4-oxalocrotonate tautomerase